MYYDKTHSNTNAYCNYTNLPVVAVLASLTILQIIGVLVSPWVGERVGRTRTLHGSLSMMLVGIGLIYWFPTLYVVVVGVLILALAMGITKRIIAIITSEIAPDYCPSLFDLGSSLGGGACIAVCYRASMNQDKSWRITYGGVGVITVITWFFSFLLTETPVYMIERRNTREAAKIIQLIEGKVEIEDALEKLVIRTEMLSRSSWFAMMSRISRPGLTFTAFSSLMTLLSAVGVFQFYGTLLFQSADLPAQALYLPPLLIFIIQTVFRITTWIYLRRLHRRPLLIIAMIVKVLTEAAMAYILFRTSTPFTYINAPWHLIISGLANVVADACLTTPGVWLKSPFPKDLAVKEATFGAAFGLFISVIMTFIPIAMCYLGKYVFYPYLFIDIGIFIFIAILVPETTNLLIGDALSYHPFWQKYVRDQDRARFV